jgi:thymidylate synthase (FAD)
MSKYIENYTGIMVTESNVIDRATKITILDKGYVEHYTGFITSEEHIVNRVTKIASISFGNDEAKNPDKLYQRLLKENAGKPNTSFEFIPVVIDSSGMNYMSNMASAYFSKYKKSIQLHSFKYGMNVDYKGKTYLLTNLRALLNDQSIINDVTDNPIDLVNTFLPNEDLDKQIIKNNFFIFKLKVPLFVFGHIVRHRVGFNVVSRRYTKGDKKPYEFYTFDDLCNKDIMWNTQAVALVEHLISDEKVSPEQAQRLLPQTLFTECWSVWNRESLENFLRLRLEKATQGETRAVAKAMYDLLEFHLIDLPEDIEKQYKKLFEF